MSHQRETYFGPFIFKQLLQLFSFKLFATLKVAKPYHCICAQIFFWLLVKYIVTYFVETPQKVIIGFTSTSDLLVLSVCFKMTAAANQPGKKKTDYNPVIFKDIELKFHMVVAECDILYCIVLTDCIMLHLKLERQQVICLII